MQKRKRITPLLAGLMAVSISLAAPVAIAEDTVFPQQSSTETVSGDETAPAETVPEIEPENNGSTNVTEGENTGETQGDLPETAPETDENQPETDEKQPDLEQNAPEALPEESSLRRAVTQAIEAGEGESVFTFEIDSSKTGPQNITDSSAGLGVDGPGAGAAYSGHAWNEEGYELITVVDNSTAAEEGISLDALDITPMCSSFMSMIPWITMAAIPTVSGLS